MNTPLKSRKADPGISFSPGQAELAKVEPATHQIKPGRSSIAAFIAFFTTVFASVAAAAAVISNDFPLMLVGL